MDFYEDLIHQGFLTILFCIALTVLFYNANTYMASLYQVKEIEREQIVYRQEKETVEELVPKGKLISYLLHQLEYDIEVDGVFISKTANVRGSIQSYSFDSDYYKKGYRYYDNGTIKAIVFFGV